MAKKISVIIPNFNGLELLKKNLPLVLKFFPQSEIIIVDDASIDGSVEFLQKQKKINLILNNKNQKFAKTVNIGAKKATGDLILLLNSDTVPRSNFPQELIMKFDDPKLFSIGFEDISHENGKVVSRGKGGAVFKRGFVNHFKLQSRDGETLWTSGGSSIIDKKKFVELGLFDENLSPFYWEDIDLCYRAWKTGYFCLFSTKFKIDHFHSEGAIQKNFSTRFIKSAAYKNQVLFVWKNISDYDLIVSHIFWLPYTIITSVMKLDFPFIVGLFWAIVKIPNLIINQNLILSKIIKSDKEILSKFE